MAVNNTLSVKEYALGTTATSFPITFEYTTDDSGNAENIHCQRAMKNDEGQYIESEELSEGLAGDFTISGGNVNYIDDATQAGKYLIIYRSTPVNQLTDFIDNGNYSLEDIERALDKLTFILQERTGTPVGTYINVGVSLFFASILQLTNKKDFLNALFASWNDIADEDKPIVAGNIRGQIDAVSKAGTETIGGTKTFTYSPIINQDVSSASVSNSAAATKGFVKSYFPVSTSNIGNSQVTTAKIADGNVTTAKIADGNVTTAKIADGNVTTGKIADGNVSFSKLRIANTGNETRSHGAGGPGSFTITWDVTNFLVHSFNIVSISGCITPTLTVINNTATITAVRDLDEDNDPVPGSITVNLRVVY